MSCSTLRMSASGTPASAAMPPRDHLRDALAGVPDADIRNVLHDNAARLYHLDG